MIVLLVCDALLVIGFAVTGIRSHASGLGLLEILSTAWPFLLGLLTGWLVTRSWRRPSQLWPAGVVVVLVTVGVGMLIRVILTDGGAPLSFVLVAIASLALLLLGRRAVSLSAGSARRRRDDFRTDRSQLSPS